MYDLSQMTYIEAKKKILLCDAIIVPLGSVEQHGYVLPLNTDNIICMHIINDLCERFNLAHLPLVPFGQTWSSSNFPGTISIAPTNMQNYICDTALSLEKAGAKKIIFYSFHNGNQEVIKQCARSLYEQYNNIYYLNSNNMKRICENIEEITFKHNIWHAGEIEVSLMMYLSPDDIRNNKLNNSEVDNNIADLKPMKWDRFNPNGSFGDTTLSSVTKGKKIYSNLLRELNEQVEKIISDNQRISDIELFVSDLDGTLLTNKKMVTTYSIEVINIINYLISNKYRFVAYSSSTMYYFLLNEEIEKKIQRVKKFEVDQQSNNLLYTKNINSVDDVDNISKLLKIVIYLENNSDISDIYPNIKNENVRFEQTGERYWSVCHKLASKDNGLKYLQKYLFINSENTIAFGDFDNDISLFKRAKYKVAMSNASDSLILCSNFMTDSNENDGVAKFVSNKII